MSVTLTIRNFAEIGKQEPRVQAAGHKRSIAAEARKILTWVVQNANATAPVATRNDPSSIRAWQRQKQEVLRPFGWHLGEPHGHR